MKISKMVTMLESVQKALGESKGAMKGLKKMAPAAASKKAGVMAMAKKRLGHLKGMQSQGRSKHNEIVAHGAKSGSKPKSR